MRTFRHVLFLIPLIFLFGCTSKEARLSIELENISKQVDTSVNQLEKHIQSGRLRNAKLLTEYARLVKKANPEYTTIADALAEDASTRGPMFTSLKSRLRDARNEIPRAMQSVPEAQTLAQELNAINIAAQTKNYDLALTDPLNVLADMSGGKLPKITTPQTKSDGTAPAGSELIGNPNYGSWRQDSSGGTFWEWYGKYAMMSHLFNLGGYQRYSYWSSHRQPSFYHDYGRDYYSSPKQKQNYTRTETRVKKQFSQQGKKFQSPYAKSAMNQKKSVLKSPNKFKSSYGGNSAYGSNSSASKYNNSSKYGSSSYNSRSAKPSSRSFGFGGK